jgi:hypothetical protein
MLRAQRKLRGRAYVTESPGRSIRRGDERGDEHL